MNRIARTAANLVVVTGLATAALTITGTAAHAEGPNNGPGTLQVGPIVDPEVPTPEPKPEPQVDGLDEITDAPNCTHGCGGSEGPDEAAPAPESKDDEPTKPADEPTLDVDQGCFTGCDLPEEPAVSEEKVVQPTNDTPIVTPSRIDAGQDEATAAGLDAGLPSASPSDESGLGWYVGLGLFSAAAALGVALAARRMAHKNQEEVQHA